MYRYDEFDAEFVNSRVAQFRGQVERRLDGRLSEAEFRPLRLMNGLYLQLHAYMLRVAVPYGTLRTDQLRMLAHLADKYDKGYGHVTTRQNMQFNWPALSDVPDMLSDLATVDMHAIQTSGNCIRNVTCDPYAGATADEIEDPRPLAELIRQWSMLHPEFSFLPRKFKFAVTASPHDRAMIKGHDIGIQIVKNDAGEVGYHIIVGGGLGRTPVLGETLCAFLPKADLLPYLTATMRVYNRFGRRDNKYKARIKILVRDTGIADFTKLVDDEFATLDVNDTAVSQEECERIASYFEPPTFDTNIKAIDLDSQPEAFRKWVATNVAPHIAPGYAIVNISLKNPERAPGDITAEQMRAVADLADRESFGEVRTTHQQNMVLPHVRQDALRAVWDGLVAAELEDANINLIGDIICCPGMDFCALATARSIPVAQAIAERFSDHDRQQAIGEMQIKISGCINACGHHHVGHIGILGLEKSGVEFYQVTLGGDATHTAAIGDKMGAGFSQDELVDGIERIVDFYMGERSGSERFLDTYRRLGTAAFKEALYAST
ncbi:sulfite reductase [Algimonas arctica]|uniref:Sulfite reductase n=1 Tax=Algimonas arctica TaxID=1479486 RepID=A0A8J3CP27_9PROT|nr:nitrite/sulfite reductase [Algimonas arctica]GHA84005.1 sulfite reductase [Algimonas arctica]